MRSRPVILRFAAFFLLLVFSQKAGAGLLLHNLFHGNISNHKNSEKQDADEKAVNYGCSCIDDLLMPFTEAEELGFSIPVPVFITLPVFLQDEIPVFSTVLLLLRGPPARIA